MNLDFFNSIGNTLNDGLYKLDKSMHNQIKGTFVDDFIHELRDYLNKSDAMYKLSKLPKDTIFYINEAYDDYIDCRVVDTTDKFDIPRDMFHPKIRDSVTDDLSRVQLQEDGFYHYVPKQ